MTTSLPNGTVHYDCEIVCASNDSHRWLSISALPSCYSQILQCLQGMFVCPTSAALRIVGGVAAGAADFTLQAMSCLGSGRLRMTALL